MAQNTLICTPVTTPELETTSMLTFETLGSMLLGFISQHIPSGNVVRGDLESGSFRIVFDGTATSYQVRIYPKHTSDPTAYMWFKVTKPTGAVVESLTFRAVACSANMTYELKYNFGTVGPQLEMRQGRGRSVLGTLGRLQPVVCIDLVVLDLIDLMLPPVLEDCKPQSFTDGFRNKPCILCRTSILGSHVVCEDCHPHPAVTTV